ncbi:aspartate kinase [Heliorestis acidaminivorans]|uniref:Aspartokinase n=1 Tax=Heliorestis acidaminivorans TaxID=553427 RepID=A0A6I0F9X1_9FIRM|nr:aspartate kinase [Heliorestis acidaminivorans]KAB2954338.1 aspartate kinase [Heliorestis acidaminivorans]
MKIVVQKFGGTSVATEELRQQAIKRIKEAREEGYHVVVVVSAMGRKGAPYATDTLLSLTESIEPNLPGREKDILMACGEIISGVVMTAQMLRSGMEAIFLTGWQSGILTSDHFGEARILSIKPDKIFDELKKGKIVIVAGFQGSNEEKEITTLGRGGSDTTAVALGAAMKAELVDIFTDVAGVMTADPRLVKGAKFLDKLTYQEVCQLAQEGAKIIHPRAVDMAMQRQLTLRIRSTTSPAAGTLITDKEKDNIFAPQQRLITGIAHRSQITQIKLDISQLSKPSEIELKVFKAMAEAGISVDFINVSPRIIIFTVDDTVAPKAIEILKSKNLHPDVISHCAKVAVVGMNMMGVPGVMARVVEALTRNQITILQSADSYTTIWCLIEEKNLTKAANALHQQFCLD